jgi:hypothetical protein
MTSRDNAIVFPHGKHDKEARSRVQIGNPPRDLKLPSQECHSPTSELEEVEGRRKWVWKRWRTHVNSSDILNESYFPYLFVAALLSFVFKS